MKKPRASKWFFPRSERLTIRVSAEFIALVNEMVETDKKNGFISSQADVVMRAVKKIAAQDFDLYVQL